MALLSRAKKKNALLGSLISASGEITTGLAPISAAQQHFHPITSINFDMSPDETCQLLSWFKFSDAEELHF